MFIRSMLGEPEHIALCSSFIQFEAFGSMDYGYALDSLEDGFLEIVELPLLPMERNFTAIKLTKEGKQQSKAIHKLWKTIYVPLFEKTDYVFEDEYGLPEAVNFEFALSVKRFEKEREAGRLNETLKKCPQITVDFSH